MTYHLERFNVGPKTDELIAQGIDSDPEVATFGLEVGDPGRQAGQRRPGEEEKNFGQLVGSDPCRKWVRNSQDHAGVHLSRRLARHRLLPSLLDDR